MQGSSRQQREEDVCCFIHASTQLNGGLYRSKEDSSTLNAVKASYFTICNRNNKKTDEQKSCEWRLFSEQVLLIGLHS